jgi:restriction endonuclease S subunit
MQLEGYWRDRSSGASSTMKKITRSQLNAVVIPLSPLDEQRQIAARLHEQLAEIDRAKAALEAQRKGHRRAAGRAAARGVRAGPSCVIAGG